MRLDDIAIPASPAARMAHEVAAAYCSPALLNHSVRSYLWSASYAALNGIAFDAELLYVSSLLHDIGLVKEFDSHTVPFEEAGGHVAWVFCAGAGWAPERRARAAQIVVRHMWDEVDVSADPESHLLELATSLDISGRRPGDWPGDFRAEVLRRHPRLDLGTEFLACFRDQAERKPGSSAAQAVRGGIADRIAANPLGGSGRS
ncbi:HD domain-containing protein [Sphaerisporangium sp. NPDC051011]|uniref:HD domain-containing protein n=1 Tax=Sphaerisporangium sp. NPDC051011 TaxID=3155792 RepID=UPI00340932B4